MSVLTAARPVRSPAQDCVVLPLCDDEATVAGEFDLRRKLDAALTAGPACVLVDLAGCSYLDAPGLRVLLEARAQATAQGTRLQLQHCSPHVVRLLGVAGHPVEGWHGRAG